MCFVNGNLRNYKAPLNSQNIIVHIWMSLIFEKLDDVHNIREQVVHGIIIFFNEQSKGSLITKCLRTPVLECTWNQCTLVVLGGKEEGINSDAGVVTKVQSWDLCCFAFVMLVQALM